MSPPSIESSEEKAKSIDGSKIKSIREIADVKTIPSCYIYNHIFSDEIASLDSQDEIPTVDFSFLLSVDQSQRSRVVHDIGKACRDWGFFKVVNHGVPESIMKAVTNGVNGFFNLAEEDKKDFKGKHVLDPIKSGTSFNQTVEKIHFWRDFLKVFVHPEFHFPNKPAGFSDVAKEYCERTREVARELLGGISESLGQERDFIENKLDIKRSGLQVFTANHYPPCPQAELAMGIPPHTDNGLITLLIQNGVGGLQIHHNGKWIVVNAPADNSFLVNTGDHLEILTNGKYKSVVHRAVVNAKFMRNSIAVVQAPPLDQVVGPAKELLDGENDPLCHPPMRYKDYLVRQQANRLDVTPVWID